MPSPSSCEIDLFCSSPHRHSSSLPLDIQVSTPSPGQHSATMYRKIAALSALVAAAKAQQVCTLQTETHPSLTWQTCAAGGTCTSKTGSVVIDANWRWVHTAAANTYTNCYTGNEWDTSICDTDTECASTCCVDGSDYSSTYGITTSGNALNLKFVTQGSSAKNIGSRTYLMASDTAYQTFTLLGNEFTFDVDVSNLPVSQQSCRHPGSVILTHI